MSVAKKRHLQDERGAVTVDMVALVAGILLLGIAVVYAIFGAEGVGSTVSEIQGTLGNERDGDGEDDGGERCRDTSPIPCPPGME